MVKQKVGHYFGLSQSLFCPLFCMLIKCQVLSKTRQPDFPDPTPLRPPTSSTPLASLNLQWNDENLHLITGCTWNVHVASESLLFWGLVDTTNIETYVRERMCGKQVSFRVSAIFMSWERRKDNSCGCYLIFLILPISQRINHFKQGAVCYTSK